MKTRPTHSPATIFVLALLLSVAAAQETGTANPGDGNPAEIRPDEEIIDEVTVLGVRELASLRAEVARAEDAVFELYNDLNDDDRYDIICKKEARIGSQIPRRVCQARFFREAVADAAEDAADGEGLSVVKVNSAKQNLLLRKKMAALASEHPELLAALKKRLALSKKLERERARKFD